MATLQIENIPEELYAKLQELAAAQNRSISAFAIAILETGLQTKTKSLSAKRKKSVTEILAEISRRRESRPANMGMILDSTANL
ncbi:MAG: FitA-like ribbon-helix-helix domain-containing protein [Microcoleus sp.]